MTRFSKLIIPLCIVAILQSTAHSQIIDTFPQWNGSNFMKAWGTPITGTYGQTFTAGSQQYLTGIEFAISNPASSNEPFQAFVYKWDGTTISGSPVFSGANPSGSVVVNPAFASYKVNTGAVPLTAGQQYVAFYTTTTSGGFDNENRWGYLGTSIEDGVDAYTGGQFVFNNSTSFPNLTAGWLKGDFGQTIGCDLAFRLTFVPEPSTAALLVIGCVAIVVARRRPVATFLPMRVSRPSRPIVIAQECQLFVASKTRRVAFALRAYMRYSSMESVSGRSRDVVRSTKERKISG